MLGLPAAQKCLGVCGRPLSAWAAPTHHHVLGSQCQKHETALATSSCYTWGWPLRRCWRHGEPLCLSQLSLGNPEFLVKTDFKLCFSPAANVPMEQWGRSFFTCAIHTYLVFILSGFFKAIIVSSSVCFKPWNNIWHLLYTLALICKVFCKPELSIPVPL